MKIYATCSICEKTKGFKLTDDEAKLYEEYQIYGRQMGYLQELFPRVPAWIRSGAIDKYAGGFCICPKCGGV